MGSLSPAVPSAASACNPLPTIPLEAAGNNRRRKGAKPNGRARKSQVRSAPGNRVLMFGNIRELALYRAEVLRSHGFSVSIPDNEAEAIAGIRRASYDAVVLTYTLSNDTVEELTELVRQYCPDCRLITISDTKYPDPKINPDANVLADDGPKALLEALRATLGR